MVLQERMQIQSNSKVGKLGCKQFSMFWIKAVRKLILRKTQHSSVVFFLKLIYNMSLIGGAHCTFLHQLEYVTLSLHTLV